MLICVPIWNTFIGNVHLFISIKSKYIYYIYIINTPHFSEIPLLFEIPYNAYIISIIILIFVLIKASLHQKQTYYYRKNLSRKNTLIKKTKGEEKGSRGGRVRVLRYHYAPPRPPP